MADKVVKIKDSKTGKITQVTEKNGSYYKAGNVVTLSPTQSPITKKAPVYMMYGKEAATMMGGSPLAKYGCSKKYKKGK